MWNRFSNGNANKTHHNMCNKGIGCLGDDAGMCRMAAEYLERHEEI